jgi:predicted MFS family arabinose efflux permease
MYTYYFFQSWFHTYLVNARGFSEKNLLLSSLPYFVAAAANCGGGFLSNVFVKKIGLKWGRCSIGLASLSLSAVCTVAVMLTQQQLGAMILLTLVYAGITFQQPIMFAVCLDIGGPYAGAMVGAMNTSAQVGAFASSLTFGYLVDRYASYTLPFIPMALLLLVGAAFWFRVDPTKPLIAARRTHAIDGVPLSLS